MQQQRPGLPGAPLPGAVDAPQAQPCTAPHGVAGRSILRVLTSLSPAVRRVPKARVPGVLPCSSQASREDC